MCVCVSVCVFVCREREKNSSQQIVVSKYLSNQTFHIPITDGKTKNLDNPLLVTGSHLHFTCNSYIFTSSSPSRLFMTTKES